MARKITVQRVLRVVANCAVLAVLFVACKSDEIPLLPPDDEPTGEDAGNMQNPPEEDSGIDRTCFMPRPTCPCNMDGATYDCRAYYRVNEGTPEQYVACSYGHYLCAEGEWSECIGERIVVVPPNEVPPMTVFEDEPLPGTGDAGP